MDDLKTIPTANVDDVLDVNITFNIIKLINLVNRKLYHAFLLLTHST